MLSQQLLRRLLRKIKMIECVRIIKRAHRNDQIETHYALSLGDALKDEQPRNWVQSRVPTIGDTRQIFRYYRLTLIR